MGRRLIRPGAAPSAPWHYRAAAEDYGATASPDWRETDWSRELKSVAVDGVPMNYVEVGPDSGDEGPAVLVHGLGGQWQNWLENIPRLSLDRRVVAMDGSGNYVVVWSGEGPGDTTGVFFQRYSANGAPQGSETRINQTVTANTQDSPSVAMSTA